MSTPSDSPSCHLAFAQLSQIAPSLAGRDNSFDLVHCVLHVKFVMSACLAGAVTIAGACSVDQSNGGSRRQTCYQTRCTLHFRFGYDRGQE